MHPTPPPLTPGEPDALTTRRNFWAWVAYQFFYRTGWQFKMEATLVAGLVSYLSPDARILGLFATVNTLARQAVPILAAPAVDRRPFKRSALLLYWSGAILCWLVLTLFLWSPAAEDRQLTLYAFGACYTLFFVCLGASSIAHGSLLGKVIPATLRGRAMAAGMGLSGTVNVGAILAVYWLQRTGPFPPPRNYALAFSISVGCFVLALFSLLAVVESPSAPRERATRVGASLRYMLQMARRDPNLRLLMLVNGGVAIGGSLLQLYTLYWRRSYAGPFPESAILVATLCQVFWQSLSSALLGRVADERGNRVLICALLWIEATVPLVALLMGSFSALGGTWAYLAVYTLIGIRFPLYQLLVNYLLEAVPQEEHALGLGATNAIQIVTAPAPLLLGVLAQRFGFAAAFVSAAAFLAAAAWLALGLQEPRARTGERSDGKEGAA